ncbi:conserved hypothetical protein [Candidatus Desulfosporosinus infrequens]|uniref:DUF2800 domain-containing protein n=1 Tax=Candidatus Desulfosporosinus infrequens TaxID=2043169 RepID=A0A2U3KM91_9FIRM|nr:conserved hypothetical protein [Candidatus Desulfosporosinus infrequens]
MAEHALLSASSAHRWLHCQPSARLEEKFENETSEAAKEGTAAHALAEYKLRDLKTKKPKSTYDSPELERITDVYTLYARELIAEAVKRTPDASVLVEQKLDYSHLAPEGFGTADLLIVSNGILDVVDAKFGRNRVFAENNPQLKLYALGALDMFGFLYDIKTVRMTICQPRLDHISSFELSVDELIDWAETELKPLAALAFKGEGEFIAGDHCKYCRARSQCRARADANLELAKLDFKKPDLLTDEEMAGVLVQVNELEAWAKDVWVYAEKAAINQSKRWPGYKLITVKGKRKYTDEAQIAERVLAAGDYKEEDIYTVDLIGITAMTHLLGQKQFTSLLSDLCVAPPSRPGLAVESDKRKEWNPIDAAKADFEDGL